MDRKPKMGDIVKYTHVVDVDPTEHPNVSTALVTKAKEGEVCHLHVFFDLGSFIAHDTSHGGVGERGKWTFLDEI